MLSEVAEIEYKCTEFYVPSSELGVRWDDPDLGIPWPVQAPILSDRDRGHRRLSELTALLPRLPDTGQATSR